MYITACRETNNETVIEDSDYIEATIEGELGNLIQDIQKKRFVCVSFLVDVTA